MGVQQAIKKALFPILPIAQALLVPENKNRFEVLSTALHFNGFNPPHVESFQAAKRIVSTYTIRRAVWESSPVYKLDNSDVQITKTPYYTFVTVTKRM